MVAHSTIETLQDLEIDKMSLILRIGSDKPKGRCTRADWVQRPVTISRMFLILDYFPSVRLPSICNLKIRYNFPNRGGFYRPIRNKIKY